MAQPTPRKTYPKRLYPGVRLVCPSCRRVMAIVRKEMFSGDIVRVENFEAVDGILKSGQPMVCPFDGAEYGAAGRLYVTGYEGWV